MVAAKGIPRASASSASCASRSSRIRRKRSQVSSGTYFMAPAQLDRRMTSQMDLMAELTDCWVAWRLPLPLGLAFVVAEAVFLGILEMALLQPKPDVLSVRDLCRLGGAIFYLIVAIIDCNFGQIPIGGINPGHKELTTPGITRHAGKSPLQVGGYRCRVGGWLPPLMASEAACLGSGFPLSERPGDRA